MAKLDRRIREEMSPFFKVNLTRYWIDLIFSVILFWTGFLISLIGWGRPLGLMGLTLSILVVYRLGVFLHEFVHHPRKMSALIRFHEWTFGHWVGLTFLGYTVHQLHHSPKSYGTNDDPEYTPAVSNVYFGVLISFLFASVSPIFLLVRYSIVAFVLPFLPQFIKHQIFQKASSQAFNPRFMRPTSPDNEIQKLAWREFPAGLIRTSILGLILVGILTQKVIFVYYLTISGAMLINMLRALFAHKYASTGDSMQFDEQIQDSINIEGGTWMELIAPLGLQYHALHHIFNQIPGHQLRGAHKKMKELNYDWYNNVSYKSLLSVTADRLKIPNNAIAQQRKD
jgi:fatty acid desaturase